MSGVLYGAGDYASRYSQITLDSTITSPSSTRVGPTPYGLS
jgi:hypothetical protein